MDPRFFRKYLDILSERVTIDPVTGQSSDPRSNPGSDAYDIHKEKEQIAAADPNMSMDALMVGGGALDLSKNVQNWQKKQNFVYNNQGIPLTNKPVRDTTGVTRDSQKNVIGYSDTDKVYYDSRGNPARKQGVNPNIDQRGTLNPKPKLPPNYM